MSLNVDHIGNIAKLIKLGFKGNIYIVKGSKPIIELLLSDALKITQSNMELIEKWKKKKVREIYNANHVQKALDLMVEVDYNTNVKLTDTINFEFLTNNHMPLASEVRVRISDGNYKRKIIFTGDLGNTEVYNYMTLPLHKIEKCDYLIGECTYCERDYDITEETRQKDLEILNTIIRETCVEKHGKAIIPSFAIQRCQLLAMDLYKMYHDKEIPFIVVLDSPMGVKACYLLLNMLKETNHPDYELLKNTLQWDKLMLIDEFKSTERILNDNHNSYIILSASGFATAGKVVNYIEYGLPKPNNTLVFVGYSGGEGSITSQIKSKKEEIKINNHNIKNVAKAFELKSFSSHMQRKQLLDYYSNINCKAVILQHGDKNFKYQFAEDLTKEIDKKDKTTKVYVPIRNEVIELI